MSIDSAKLPIPGIYYARIEDFETHEVDLPGVSESFCIVARYRLVDMSAFDCFELIEMYNPAKGNLRAEAFETFLQRRGMDITCDEQLVGLSSTVKIVYETVAGYAFPVINFTYDSSKD